MFESLDYLYVPAPDIEAAVEFHTRVLGGELRWKVHAFGAWVACVKLAKDAAAPTVLLADHKHAGRGPQLVYRVSDFAKTVAALKARGLVLAGEPFEIPQGPCVSFCDPAGNEFAVYENLRSGVAERFEGRVDVK